MNKYLTLVLLVFLSPLIAGAYGIVHDQMTYSISPEYYTKFKFIQFGIYDFGEMSVLSHARLYATLVGFIATWWMGPPIAFVLGCVGMLHTDSKKMFRVTMKALFVTMIVAFLTGLLGLAIGKFYLASSGVSWWLPDLLKDKASFIAVGSMHNFSYLGGLTGLIAGIIYSLKQRTAGRTTQILPAEKPRYNS